VLLRKRRYSARSAVLSSTSRMVNGVCDITVISFGVV
jgi:hypothetical protein